LGIPEWASSRWGCDDLVISRADDLGRAGVQVGVDGIGDVPVGQWQGVGVLAQGGGGVGMAETGLRGQYLPAGDEEGGHGVPQTVQRRIGHAGLLRALRA